MKTTFDTSGWQQEQQRVSAQNEKIKSAARNRVKIVSLRVVGRVKVMMPVDEGAARARWGTPGAPGGIWRELDDGLTIEQGAMLEPYEYIIKLNEGSSTQAPAGFIDMEEVRAGDELVNELVNDLMNIL